MVWLCTKGGVHRRRLGPNSGSAVFCLSLESEFVAEQWVGEESKSPNSVGGYWILWVGVVMTPGVWDDHEHTNKLYIPIYKQNKTQFFFFSLKIKPSFILIYNLFFFLNKKKIIDGSLIYSQH